MPNLRYRNYYISVFHMPDKSGNSSCIACVEIRHKVDDSPAARVMLSGGFHTAQEASEHGFELGKQWVDDRLSNRGKSAPTGQIATETGGDPAPLRARFKGWIAW